MKNLYIPKGKTLHYETLYCQNIVNDGTLIVDGTARPEHFRQGHFESRHSFRPPCGGDGY